MIVTSLKLANVRGIETAEFWFRPGFNLIVGVNGVGKTSVLDSLCWCLSVFVKHANGLRSRVETGVVDDIRVGAEALTVECYAQFDGMEFQYVIHKPREDSTPQETTVGIPREQVHLTPSRSGFIGTAPMALAGVRPGGSPLAALFSTKRAVPSVRKPSTGVAAGGIKAAFAEALKSRELRIREITHWMCAQRTLGSERRGPGRALGAFEEAIVRFLPGYSNLRTDDSGRPRLLIDRGSITIPVRQMSDGERGVLALMLDLTRRLVQANPELKDPVAEAEAVVLIDELELHLHPRWQRRIIEKLVATFPRCQFIATTHSPQVVGELAHDRIHIMDDGRVYSPTHSFGVDSNRVLEEIMDAPPRNREVEAMRARISREIGKERYEQARQTLAELVDRLGENDPEITRLSTLLDFMEGEG